MYPAYRITRQGAMDHMGTGASLVHGWPRALPHDRWVPVLAGATPGASPGSQNRRGRYDAE